MFLGFNCAAIASEDDLFSIVNSATDPSVFSDYSSSITDPGDLDVTSDVVAIPGGNLEQNIFSDDLNDASSYADFTDPSSSLFASENNGDDNSTPLLLADSNNQGCASETSQLLNGLRARNEACANNDRGSSDMSLSSQLSSFINLDTMKLKAICPSQLYIPFSIAVCSSGKKNNIGWLPIDVPISQILSYDLIDAQISKLTLSIVYLRGSTTNKYGKQIADRNLLFSHSRRSSSLCLSSYDFLL